MSSKMIVVLLLCECAGVNRLNLSYKAARCAMLSALLPVAKIRKIPEWGEFASLLRSAVVRSRGSQFSKFPIRKTGICGPTLLSRGWLPWWRADFAGAGNLQLAVAPVCGFCEIPDMGVGLADMRPTGGKKCVILHHDSCGGVGMADGDAELPTSETDGRQPPRVAHVNTVVSQGASHHKKILNYGNQS